ncbi:hypothetical protein JOC95_003885 [Bacillus tianshenii]|uniref:Uncharacterized protein n=1 Tax=Sutcliffiella tianshenii TaxID=1463404 RepID=A0ABS2P5S3_9BACI|nr:hypothetical protein [Bacillus tianshenii]
MRQVDRIPSLLDRIASPGLLLAVLQSFTYACYFLHLEIGSIKCSFGPINLINGPIEARFRSINPES